MTRLYKIDDQNPKKSVFRKRGIQKTIEQSSWNK